MHGIFRTLDIYDAWKAIAIALTGFFAVLGVASDTKDPQSHRLSPWGWVVLIGAIISATGGVITQLHDSADENRRRAANTNSTNRILSNLDKSLGENTNLLQEIQNTATRLQTIGFGIKIKLPLSSPLVKDYADRLGAIESDLEDAVDQANGHFPKEGTAPAGVRVITTHPNDIVPLSIYKVITDSEAYPNVKQDHKLGAFVQNISACVAIFKNRADFAISGSEGDLKFCLSKFEAGDNLQLFEEPHNLDFLSKPTTISSWSRTTKISSLKDLEGSTVFIRFSGDPDYNEYWNLVEPVNVDMVIDRIAISVSTFFTPSKFDKDHPKVLSFTFPKVSFAP